jgi:hypothetical protein
MLGKAQLAPRRGRAAIVLLVVLLASLIAYKTGPALRAIRTAQSAGQLKPRPYLVNSALSAKPGVLWTEFSAYLRIIWPGSGFRNFNFGCCAGGDSARLVRLCVHGLGTAVYVLGGCSWCAPNAVLLLRSSCI